MSNGFGLDSENQIEEFKNKTNKQKSGVLINVALGHRSLIVGYDIRGWKTGAPCYAVVKCLVKLSPMIT